MKSRPYDLRAAPDAGAQPEGEKMKYTFEAPKIIGALCKRESDIPAELIRLFKKFGKKVAFLPFVVERKHLKNTVACMKLVDVEALFVCGGHRREIVRHLSRIDSWAKKKGEVDCVVRKSGRFVGINIADREMRRNVVAASTKARPVPKKTSGKQGLPNKKALGLFCQSVVEVLTQGLK